MGVFFFLVPAETLDFQSAEKSANVLSARCQDQVRLLTASDLSYRSGISSDTREC